MSDSEHSEWVGQPHPQGEPEPITAAEAAAAELSDADHPLGTPGRRFDRRSPFMIGVAGAGGVLATVCAVKVVFAAHEALLLVVAALFLAIGMEPAVSWLARHRIGRGPAVTLVLLVIVAALAGFLAALITPLVDQGQALVDHAPDRLHQLENSYPAFRSAADRLHLDEKVQQGIDTKSADLAHGLVGAGKVVFGAVTGTVVVFVLTAYFSACFPSLRANLYRLFPQHRRPRAILIGDAIFAKVGGYVLGNLLISLITGVLTFIWLAAFGVPYPLVLAVLVAVLDLIPLVGSTLAGIVIAVVALTVSMPVCLATVGFFLVLRLVEDYLLAPRIMGRTVEVPGVVTVVAVLIGGSLLGILGALLAIPLAAAVLLLVREIVFPGLDKQPPPEVPTP
ncbi:AI-2E family transporter [Nocardia sp. BMG111209]|uniref:AI-2E family transporter n=1 Tax=Nocardia sp. BMG111209 TaxID=1160137 RepID=UPI00068A8EDB|nr:AI-2E family transporter [Nocardia sp. BMG111209]